MNQLLSRIAVDSQVCFCKPCVRGARKWVSLLLDFLASGATIEEILDNFPQLQREDVFAASAYGTEMSRERYVDLPGTAPREIQTRREPRVPGLLAWRELWNRHDVQIVYSRVSKIRCHQRAAPLTGR